MVSKSREKQITKVRENSKKPSTYRNRYIRDLNNGMMDITKMKIETIDKYDIKRNDIGEYYYNFLFIFNSSMSII